MQVAKLRLIVVENPQRSEDLQRIAGGHVLREKRPFRSKKSILIQASIDIHYDKYNLIGMSNGS